LGEDTLPTAAGRLRCALAPWSDSAEWAAVSSAVVGPADAVCVTCRLVDVMDLRWPEPIDRRDPYTRSRIDRPPVGGPMI